MPNKRLRVIPLGVRVCVWCMCVCGVCVSCCVGVCSGTRAGHKKLRCAATGRCNIWRVQSSAEQQLKLVTALSAVTKTDL